MMNPREPTYNTLRLLASFLEFVRVWIAREKVLWPEAGLHFRCMPSLLYDLPYPITLGPPT